MPRIQLNVLGEDISFRTDVDARRMEQAKLFVEEEYERLKMHGGQFSRDKLLILLLLGATYDLLQLQRQAEDVKERSTVLLKRIEESV